VGKGEGDPAWAEASAREDLAAAIHETTNALTVILGWIGRAREASGANPEALDALRRAARYTRTARQGMRRAIGAEVPERPPEQVAGLAERALEDLAVEAQRASIQLTSQIDDRCSNQTLVHSDAVWQVLVNLLLNAIAVTPEDGAVGLELKGEGPRVCFRVWDEGPGIAAEHRDTIFSSGHSRRSGGAGIGLRHAHALAQELGGELVLAESKTGACFELRWPLDGRPSRAPDTVPPPSGNAQAGLEGTQVLLLEDDAAVIELLELSLEARGAQVTTVTTDDDLRSSLDQRRYDVLLVDLSPLEGTLDETVDRARRTNPGIGVVVISGSVTVQPRPDIVWVRKPFEPGELVAAIVRHRKSD
jgi:CheY-like chemotaxis protein